MKVYLIGAGPGDAGLLTLKGRDALACADVVVYDALANDSLLGHARPDAERIYVGKVAGNHALPQHEINALLVRKAKEGKVVARLKGGDPYIFGRGGEEAEELLAAGVEYVVLAGYMRLLTSTFLQAFPGRVINIHPAILPSFPGAHGGPDAQAYGVKITGCTVHFVEELVDSGPVIIQAAVPANAGEELDDLMNRIHPLEHRIYPQALQWLAEGRLRVEGRQVFLAPADRKTVTPDGPWLVWPPLEEGF